jgi:hypothetical protein
VQREGRSCLSLAGDIGSAQHCEEIVRKTVERFGRDRYITRQTIHVNGGEISNG